MTTYLLDANVLIALTVTEHVHHERASEWAGTIDEFALCPVAEGALVRFLVRLGESAEAAHQVLRSIRARHGYRFWPDSLSYADASLTGVRGHRQVAGAYLVALASEQPAAALATLDESLASAHPDLTVLVPDVSCSRPHT